jgi:hypothetical protein
MSAEDLSPAMLTSTLRAALLSRRAVSDNAAHALTA